MIRMTTAQESMGAIQRHSVRRVDLGVEATRFCLGPITVYVAGRGTLDDAERATRVIHDAALYGVLCPEIVVGLYSSGEVWYLDFARCMFKPDSVTAEVARRHQEEAYGKVAAALVAGGFALVNQG